MPLMFTLKQNYFNEFQLMVKTLKMAFARWSLWLTGDADVFCTNCSNLGDARVCIQSAPACVALWYLNKEN